METGLMEDQQKQKKRVGNSVSSRLQRRKHDYITIWQFQPRRGIQELSSQPATRNDHDFFIQNFDDKIMNIDEA